MNLISLSSFRSILRGSSPWQIIVELLLIGLVVYWVVKFLQGTRGARLLKGIAFVLIFLYLVVRLVASRLGLERVVFLYGLFLQYASFAVVIVFQPELRRAIMRLGETSLFRRFSHQLREDGEEMVDAAPVL